MAISLRARNLLENGGGHQKLIIYLSDLPRSKKRCSVGGISGSIGGSTWVDFITRWVGEFRADVARDGHTKNELIDPFRVPDIILPH